MEVSVLRRLIEREVLDLRHGKIALESNLRTGDAPAREQLIREFIDVRHRIRALTPRILCSFGVNLRLLLLLTAGAEQAQRQYRDYGFHRKSCSQALLPPPQTQQRARPTMKARCRPFAG
jgi:hypothetical protein